MDAARNNPLIDEGAELIAESFRSYVEGFRDITRHARAHFESANWHGLQHDAAVRFDLYADAVIDGLLRLHSLLETRIAERPTWTSLRESFAAAVSGRGDVELAESFFNSFTRKIFHTIGIDPSVEFISSGTAVGAHDAFGVRDPALRTQRLVEGSHPRDPRSLPVRPGLAGRGGRCPEDRRGDGGRADGSQGRIGGARAPRVLSRQGGVRRGTRPDRWA